MVCATIGGIFLYKSYAYYEEDKEYNVIKGIIPDFGHDIKLSFTIDGKESTETFPNKDGNYVGSSVTCSNDVTAEWDNVNWGLKNIVANNNKKVNCNVNFKTKTTFQEKVKVGDYVKMTPSLTTFTVSKSLTGATADATIKPSELILWRVLEINSDGTIDMISEYTSSNTVTFTSEIGFKNAVGVLQMIASSYTNSKYTVRSRIPGYAGQTSFITATLNPSTSGSVSTGATSWDSSKEQYGGGDLLYKEDLKLIKNALSQYRTKAVNGSSLVNYFLASRNYNYKSSSEKRWYVRYVTNYTETSNESDGMALYGDSNVTNITSYLRPIVVLKSGVNASSGNGSNGSPWVLK